jgi:hypothetical protein
MAYMDLFIQPCHKCQTILAFDTQEQVLLPPLMRESVSIVYHLHCI